MNKFHLGPRTPVSSRYFSLPSAVPNPHYDGRCKYGHRGIKTYKAGSSIHAVDYEQECTVDGVTTTHKSTDYFLAETGSTAREVPKDVQALIAAFDSGEQQAPQTLKEAAVEAGTTQDSLCYYAIKSLLASGRLTIEDVLSAWETSTVDIEDLNT